jgi:signal transduction histidine kinase
MGWVRGVTTESHGTQREEAAITDAQPPSTGQLVTTREWLLAAAVGATVLTAGLIELTGAYLPVASAFAGMVFLLFVGAAVGIARWAPGVALGTAWLAGLTQVIAGVPLLLTEISLVVVLFAAARWGRLPTVAIAGLSGLFVPAFALAWVRVAGVSPGLGGSVFIELLGASGATSRDGRLLLLGLAVFGTPYLAGLALRFLSGERAAQRARESAERGAAQAQEIARLQEAQNRLARDVHDVVGHSLTVILAQAESAQYLDDPDRLKQTMQTIATSARTSLQDVRQVLTPGQDATAARHGGLDTLIESVRASGHAVTSTEVGAARPLPPELEAVAYRVLQELLTNAIKHGRRDQAVLVERHWPDRAGTGDALMIVVRNMADDSPEATGGGQGLVGIQRRLESVGGRFEAHRRDEPHGPVFTAIALVPVRAPLVGGPA